MAVKLLEHSLVKTKVTILRNKNTNSYSFREVLEELTIFLAYEALKKIELKEILVDTPIAKNSKGYELNEKITVVPIFRAGLGMVNGIRKVAPNIKEGHVGIYRDEKSLETVVYYNKLPHDISNSQVLILDPMLATGSTISDAICEIRKSKPKKISILSIVASPEGLKKIEDAYPDVNIYVASIDKKLNSKGYIYPGLGDAGDRIFGTK